jgi:hypothetical protein
MRQQKLMLWKNMIQLWEEIFVTGFFGLYMKQKFIHNQCYSWWRLIFLDVEKWILRIVSSGVQKIQDLLANFCVMKSCLVCDKRMQDN